MLKMNRKVYLINSNIKQIKQGHYYGAQQLRVHTSIHTRPKVNALTSLGHLWTKHLASERSSPIFEGKRYRNIVIRGFSFSELRSIPSFAMKCLVICYAPSVVELSCHRHSHLPAIWPVFEYIISKGQNC